MTLASRSTSSSAAATGSMPCCRATGTCPSPPRNAGLPGIANTGELVKIEHDGAFANHRRPHRPSDLLRVHR